MATGRTPSKFIKVQIEDNGAALRDIEWTTIGDVGIVYDSVDVSALTDALKSGLTGQGSFGLDITGPMSNKAAVAASTTGVHAACTGCMNIFPAMNGVQTPRSFAVYIGIQADWATGDPVFGAVDCVNVTSFTVTQNGTMFSAHIALAGNRVNDPAWGSAQIAAA